MQRIGFSPPKIGADFCVRLVYTALRNLIGRQRSAAAVARLLLRFCDFLEGRSVIKQMDKKNCCLKHSPGSIKIHVENRIPLDLFHRSEHDQRDSDRNIDPSGRPQLEVAHGDCVHS